MRQRHESPKDLNAGKIQVPNVREASIALISSLRRLGCRTIAAVRQTISRLYELKDRPEQEPLRKIQRGKLAISPPGKRQWRSQISVSSSGQTHSTGAELDCRR